MINNSPPTEAGYETVAEAIIMQALTDLFYCYMFGQAPIGEKSRVNINECEAFFRSGWFIGICPGEINGESVIEETKEAAERARNARWFIKRKGKKHIVYNEQTGEERCWFEHLEDAYRRAASLNGLTVWQFNILLTGRPRKRKKRV